MALLDKLKKIKESIYEGDDCLVQKYFLMFFEWNFPMAP
jgi:hypothetical protein